MRLEFLSKHLSVYLLNIDSVITFETSLAAPLDTALAIPFRSLFANYLEISSAVLIYQSFECFFFINSFDIFFLSSNASGNPFGFCLWSFIPWWLWKFSRNFFSEMLSANPFALFSRFTSLEISLSLSFGIALTISLRNFSSNIFWTNSPRILQQFLSECLLQLLWDLLRKFL